MASFSFGQGFGTPETTCGICGSPGTNRVNCPKNLYAKDRGSYKKHPFARWLIGRNPPMMVLGTPEEKELALIMAFIESLIGKGSYYTVQPGTIPEYVVGQLKSQGFVVTFSKPDVDRVHISWKHSPVHAARVAKAIREGPAVHQEKLSSTLNEIHSKIQIAMNKGLKALLVEVPELVEADVYLALHAEGYKVTSLPRPGGQMQYRIEWTHIFVNSQERQARQAKQRVETPQRYARQAKQAGERLERAKQERAANEAKAREVEERAREERARQEKAREQQRAKQAEERASRQEKARDQEQARQKNAREQQANRKRDLYENMQIKLTTLRREGLLASFVGTPVECKTLEMAFRRWLIDNHPDKGGSTEKFVDVHGAYKAIMGYYCGRPV